MSKLPISTYVLTKASNVKINVLLLFFFSSTYLLDSCLTSAADSTRVVHLSSYISLTRNISARFPSDFQGTPTPYRKLSRIALRPTTSRIIFPYCWETPLRKLECPSFKLRLHVSPAQPDGELHRYQALRITEENMTKTWIRSLEPRVSTSEPLVVCNFRLSLPSG